MGFLLTALVFAAGGLFAGALLLWQDYRRHVARLNAANSPAEILQVVIDFSRRWKN